MQKQIENGKPLPDGEQKCARVTLSRILESPAFRASKQCQSFLQYVFEHSLSGLDEPLKERDIGVRVFGRKPEYNTGDDPIVRVRATEVRRRLTQYYAESVGKDDVRIDIPPGRYRVEFHRDAPKGAPVRRKGFWSLKRPFWLAAAGVLILVSTLAGGALLYHRREAPTVVDQFWAQFLGNPKAVVIYCGRPVAYFLSSNVYEKYGPTWHAGDRAGDQALPLWRVLALPPDAVIRGRDIIPVTDKFVGVGSAHAAILLHGLFVERHKQVDVRYADDLSFSDLRTSPTILIGAFSNLWTLQMMRELRFVFERTGPGHTRIRDREGNRTWEWAHGPDGSAPDDYAIVSRILDSATGQPLISIAGIGTFGTRSAAEFATNLSFLREALAAAPANWPNKNLQVVLHSDVYGGLPGRPKVLALHLW